MSNLQFTLIQPEDSHAVITVFVKGEKPAVADDTHPNFEAILAGALADDASVLELWDVAETVSKRFQSLSEQVSVANGKVYFDGDEVDDSLTEQILRFLDEGLDFMPLVRFFEKVRSNPEVHSQKMLYEFLNARDFTITDTGDFVAYKGVKRASNGSLVSGWSGKATVNGEIVEGNIPNELNSVVEMPRSEVRHDPKTHCSVGLHVGTYEYAKSYAQGAMLEVWVNPRDVVSVPDDSAGEKMRVCRYYVADTIEAPLTSAVRYTRSDYDGWGEYDYSDAGDETDEPGAYFVGDGETYCLCCDSFLEDCDCDESCASAVTELAQSILPGDIFMDTDSRRRGRKLTVLSVAGNDVLVQGESGLKRSIHADRLLSYKYKRV